jgi:hypothetical protein
MEAILSSASDPTDLIRISDAKLPYRFDQIFAAKGFGAKRLAKNRLRLMKAIDPHLRTILSDGEKVLLVSWGIEYSFMEQFFMGLWAHLINRRALIFTDRRILMIQINSRRKVLDLRSQLRYQAIDQFAKRTFGYVGLLLRNGRKFKLTGVPGKDRKAIKKFVADRISETRADAPGLGIENLCPKCGNRVMGFPDRCNQCAQAFKSARRAGWLSLAFPGLGDLYLGHRWLGGLEILGGLFAWGTIVIPLAWLALGGESSWLTPASAASGVFVFVHGTDCWITRRMGLKGIYPES